jgi:DNA-binding NtrC family response regulator
VFKRAGKVVGFLDVEDARSASTKLGAYAVLEKPVNVEELLLTADRAHRVAAERHAISLKR